MDQVETYYASSDSSDSDDELKDRLNSMKSIVSQAEASVVKVNTDDEKKKKKESKRDNNTKKMFNEDIELMGHIRKKLDEYLEPIMKKKIKKNVWSLENESKQESTVDLYSHTTSTNAGIMKKKSIIDDGKIKSDVESSESEDDERFKEAAVTPESILTRYNY